MNPELQTLAQTWLADLKLDRAVSTVQRYGSVVRRFLQWVEYQEHRSATLDDLTPIGLVGYVHMLKQHEQPSTVNIHIAALRTWGMWLVRQRLLESNPAQRLKFIRRERPTAPRDLSPNEINALLREVARTGRYPLRNTAIMMVLLQTGIRIGECVALRWGDITFGEKSGWLHVRTGKGDKARSVPLNSSARQALADYVAPGLGVESSLKAVSQMWSSIAPEQPLWQTERGTMTLSAMERALNMAITACAFRGHIPPTTTPHAFRHTFARRYLLRHPGDLVGLARLLGHASLDTTAIYLQPTARDIEQRVEDIDINAY